MQVRCTKPINHPGKLAVAILFYNPKRGCYRYCSVLTKMDKYHDGIRCCMIDVIKDLKKEKGEKNKNVSK